MYGKRSNLVFTGLSPEELAKVEPLSEERIQRALREGYEIRRAVEKETVLPRIASGTRFR